MLSTAVPADTTVIAKPSPKQHGDAKDDDRRCDPQTRLAAVEADQRGGPSTAACEIVADNPTNRA